MANKESSYVYQTINFCNNTTTVFPTNKEYEYNRYWLVLLNRKKPMGGKNNPHILSWIQRHYNDNYLLLNRYVDL